MFDDTVYDLGDLPSHEQAVDIACEIVAICDQLHDLRMGKGNRRLGYYEAIQLQADYDLMISHCEELLARLGYELKWGVEEYPVIAPLRSRALELEKIDSDVDIEFSSRDDDIDIAC